jgi:hypothetical protein
MEADPSPIYSSTNVSIVEERTYNGTDHVHYFLASDIDRLYANLSTLSNYEVYKKSQIPDEYHYRFNVRIGGKRFPALSIV